MTTERRSSLSYTAYSSNGLRRSLDRILRLESYEDALNNLQLKRSPEQSLLLDSDAEAREQYLLSYMLDVESRGSLLNIEAFREPTSYQLRVERDGESKLVNVDLLETFNWLLGLTVQQINAPMHLTAEFTRDSEGRLEIKKGSFKARPEGKWWVRTVVGTNPHGHKVLVIWRNLSEKPEEDNLVLETWFTSKQGYSSLDKEFDLIYVNGGNNLENLKTAEEPVKLWKVRLIEEDFQRLMFEES